MAEKKKPGRFTIQFNTGDPKQMSAAELLEQQGRHKAQFITAAILHYINCPETSEIAAPASIDKALLEKLVMEILERRQSQSPAAAINRPAAKEQRAEHSAEVANNLEEMFGQDGISAITNTLTAFQSE